MSNQQRMAVMRDRLEAALEPESLDIEDQSHLHKGHPGARDGRGHFALRIVSSAFEGKNPLERHRMVYAALGDLMQTDIHALTMRAYDTREINE
ncbi:MAG: BolA family protein [Xanthomonadales bacterium]|nr:BolA family protein [Xanthomonadales bacterium]